MRHEESRIQTNCVTWFRLVYPTKHLILFSVPNGGARRASEGRILKAEGIVAGVSDLLLLHPSCGYHGLCIEMKTATGRQRDTQKAWQRAVEAEGYKYLIIRSFDEFRAEVSKYMKGIG